MTELQEILALWYQENQRDLPWREDPTPYHVWLSEVILQQTRIIQGIDYYNRFINRWPELQDLANATEEEVLKMWQGLGYYSRARNLHRCAQQVMERYNGVIPSDFKLIRELAGIGDYTASAIASIAYGLPFATVDGNVYRVLSRLFDIDTPINNREGIKLFAQLAEELLDREHPGRHNQALMEFGALHCLPQNPRCVSCPLQAHCLSFAHGTVNNRPQKEDKIKIRKRYLYYFVFRTDSQQIGIKKRTGKDIWQNLYDFPVIESQEEKPVEELLNTLFTQTQLSKENCIINSISKTYIHKLSHQTLMVKFIEIKFQGFLSIIQTKDILLVSEMELSKYPVPKLIENYFKTLTLKLS